MKKLICLLIMVMLVSGCNAMYWYCRYQPTDIWGCGYKVAKIQDNIYSISFTGSQNDNFQRIKDFALLRSADTTVENDYKYFVIMEDDLTGTSYGTTGQINPGGTVSVVTQQRNTVTYTIQCFKKKPQDTKAIVYDAEQISANLRKTYKIK